MLRKPFDGESPALETGRDFHRQSSEDGMHNIHNIFEGLETVRSLNRGAGRNAFALKFYGNGVFGIERLP